MKSNYDDRKKGQETESETPAFAPPTADLAAACAVCGHVNPAGTAVCELCSNDIPSDAVIAARLRRTDRHDEGTASVAASPASVSGTHSHRVREDAKELPFDESMSETEDPHPMSRREEKMLRNLSLGKKVRYLPPHAVYATHRRRLSRRLEAEANAIRQDKYVRGLLGELTVSYNEMFRWFRTTHGASYLYEAVRMADTQMRLESELMTAVHAAAPYGTADAVGDYLLYRFAKGHAFCLDFRRKNAALLPAIRLRYENGSADFIKCINNNT